MLPELHVRFSLMLLWSIDAGYRDSPRIDEQVLSQTHHKAYMQLTVTCTLDFNSRRDISRTFQDHRTERPIMPINQRGMRHNHSFIQRINPSNVVGWSHEVIIMDTSPTVELQFKNLFCSLPDISIPWS